MATSDSRDEFVVIEVPPDAPGVTEAMGSKPKFWFQDEQLGRCLYKQSRPGGGEDWAEKIACELCKLVGLPHANYELANWKGLRGTVSPSFVPENGTLVHGNEILVKIEPDYPQPTSGARHYCRVPQHTVDVVLSVIGGRDKYGPYMPLHWTPPRGISDACEVLAGYLMLDAWIGNQDRHHENWGLLVIFRRGDPPIQIYLAPTYDHASSLGCNESDETRRQRLSTSDSGYKVEAYVRKAKSKLFANKEDTQPLTTLDAFRQAATYYPAAARIWLDRLANVSNNDTLELLNRIPSDRLSPVGIEFAQEILEANRRRLVALLENLT